MSAARILFSTEIFMPRGHSYFWTPGLLALDLLGNALAALACLTAAATFARAARNRGGTLAAAPIGRLATPAAIFFALWAATFLMDALVVWRPLFWLAGLLRAAAALAALLGAVTLLRLSRAGAPPPPR